MKTKRIFTGISLLLLGFTLLSTHSVSQTMDTLCGPRSLKMICDQFKVKTTIEELSELSGYDPVDGTSLLGLYRAAKAKKLPAKGVKLDFDDLCALNSPSIVFVDDRHFLVVMNCTADSVTVSIAPGKPYAMTKDDFLKRWAGEALVFSESSGDNNDSTEKQSSSQLDGKPNVSFDETKIDFGIVDGGAVLTHTFNLKNTGSSDLKLNVRSSCNCTVAIMSDDVIKPGDEGKIHVKYTTESLIKGKISQYVYVRTNDPDNRIMKLTLDATLRGNISVVPSKIWFGKLPVNSELSREINVVDSGDNTLEVIDIALPKNMKAEILQVKTVNSIITVPIQFTIKAGNSIGDFQDLITVYTNDKSQSEIIIPVSGSVTGSWTATPPNVYFGVISPQTENLKKITIVSDNPLNTEKFNTSVKSPFITLDLDEPSINSKEITLHVKLDAPSQETEIVDAILLYNGDENEPVLQIPVYAKVKN